jgi:hypothetical protein
MDPSSHDKLPPMKSMTLVMLVGVLASCAAKPHSAPAAAPHCKDGSHQPGRACGDATLRETRAQAELKPEPLHVSGRGAVNLDVLQKAIDERADDIQVCYENALKIDPTLHGTVRLAWTITEGGHVARVRVRSSTVKSETLLHCMTERVAIWKFQSPIGGELFVDDYPFIFSSADAE